MTSEGDEGNEGREKRNRIANLYDDITITLFQIKDISALERILHLVSKELLETKNKEA